MSFRCPVCRTTVYEQLPPAADGRAGVRLYACAGCAVVFADPDRASRGRAGIPGQPAASPDFARVLAARKIPGRPPRAGSARRRP